MGTTAIVAALAMSAVGTGVSISQSMNKPDMPTADPPPSLTDGEADGQKAAAKRRKLYSGMGRSSTILTGQGGLSTPPPTDNTAPKQLLGL